MSSGILACGPNFADGALVSSLVLFLLIKPAAYFAYVHAFRFRVNRAVPITAGQAAKLAACRALLGVVLIGGGAYVLAKTRRGESAVLASWVYMFAARIFAWWSVGRFLAKLQGRRLFAWIFFGTLMNVAFDGAVIAGVFVVWYFAAPFVAGIGVLIVILLATGSRDRLRMNFSGDPLCGVCQYNLTGNLSGICPECGTPIPQFSQ